MNDLLQRDAVTLRRMIGRRKLSPVELMEATIARIEAVDPAVNAMVTTCFDRALEEASLAEQQVQQGDSLGALHGLPLGVKDLQATKDLRTTYASPIYADNVPDKDARLVTMLRKAGAIVIGKTNTPEFGAGANTTNAVFGPTRNPFDTAVICGGSSGGSAVALATGMVPLATGSDMGGSLRTPAAFCGVVGFRPSAGLIPSDDRLDGWSSLGVDGPMGRTVADVGFMLQAMVGRSEDDALSFPMVPGGFDALPEIDTASLRIAVSPDLGFAAVDSGIRATFEAVIDRLILRFASVDRRDPPLQGSDEIFAVLRAVQFLAGHEDQYHHQRELLGPNLIANLEEGFGYSISDVARAQVARTALLRRFAGFMADYDCLIAPTASVAPFPVEQLYATEVEGKTMGSYIEWLGLAYGITLTGHPSVSIPCGRNHLGTPFGIQICGRRGEDRKTLAIAAAIERAIQDEPQLGRPIPDIAALTLEANVKKRHR